jgi:outer membrane immunogenic protein
MLKNLILAAVAVSAFSGVAQAADAVNEVPAAPVADYAAPASSWGGFYGGVTSGYAWDKVKLDDGNDSGSTTFNGARFGGFAGYNAEIAPSIILGAEGELAYNWGDKTVDDAKIEAGVNGSARARVGYAFDKALVYAAGGYAVTKGKLSVPGYSDSDTFHGWTVGVGVDYAVTDNIFARAEYRYNDFGKNTYTDGADSYSLKVREHQVNVGVGYKF